MIVDTAPVEAYTVHWEEFGDCVLETGSDVDTDENGESVQSVTVGGDSDCIIRATCPEPDTEECGQADWIVTPYEYVIGPLSGDNQKALPDKALGAPLQVGVLAGGEKPSSETLTIDWAIIEGDGALQETQTMTDSEGVTSVSFTAGTGNAVISATLNADDGPKTTNFRVWVSSCAPLEDCESCAREDGCGFCSATIKDGLCVPSSSPEAINCEDWFPDRATCPAPGGGGKGPFVIGGVVSGIVVGGLFVYYCAGIVSRRRNSDYERVLREEQDYYRKM